MENASVRSAPAKSIVALTLKYSNTYQDSYPPLRNLNISKRVCKKTYQHMEKAPARK